MKNIPNYVLEVASLREYVDSYKGGKGDIRSMEGMIQQITQDCANAVKTVCHVRAELVIEPNQEMILDCSAHFAADPPLTCRICGKPALSRRTVCQKHI